MGSKAHNPEAFLDQGYIESSIFCEKFLSSPEFTVDFLTKYDVPKINSQKNKDGYAADLAYAIINGILDPKVLLLDYVKKPRTWLSFKEGKYTNLPTFLSPENLLTSFGDPGWYGPIREKDSFKVWYIYTVKIPHRIPINSNVENSQKNVNGPKLESFETKYIRWPIIAEVDEKYVALSWNGFSHTEEDKPNSKNQFSYWLHIPDVFDQLEEKLCAEWKHPELHKLLLYDMWEKFTEDSKYEWSHRRVRAHSSGIALNAHSSSDTETEYEVKGLKALSHKLAESTLDALEYIYPFELEVLSKVEKSLLNTLVREWGTKSYEFTLKKLLPFKSEANNSSSQDKDDQEETNAILAKTLFRVHCYFGLNKESNSQDSLQHLKCYKECNFSNGALKFLLSELEL